jgi:hypothetical protein
LGINLAIDNLVEGDALGNAEKILVANQIQQASGCDMPLLGGELLTRLSE